MSFARITALLLAMLLFTGLGAMAQPSELPQLGPRAAPTQHVQVNSLPALNMTPDFDPTQATARYLAQVSGDARAKSDAYFTGGYWLLLVDLLYALAVAGLLLWTGTSARIQDWAAARTLSRSYQVMLYAAAYVAITGAAMFPLTVYEGFFREHRYGLSTQNFWQWLGDFGIQFALTFAATVLLLPILYLAIRRAREMWWLWAAGLAIAFQILTIMIWPVFISPLFNHYTPLPDSPLKAKILALARANDVPVDNVWLVDASRQSNRISANVSGFMGTARISLNDNLLNRGTQDEVLAVMGHEIGHYVMGHTTRLLLLNGLVILAGFLFIHWGFVLACDVFGGQWQVRKISEVAGLPLIVALAAIFLFLATPVTNSIVRVVEYQADIFGLNAVRKPDGFATAMLKLSPYRKLEPGRWEERIFYDHPSGRTRIAAAMRWKKEHIGDLDLRETANLP
jgi:STE24 endopeptidase